MGKLVDIPLLFKVGNDVFSVPYRPVMTLKFNFSLTAPGVDGFIEKAGPNQCISHLSTAQGQDVMHGIGGVFCHPKCFHIREPGIHFGWSLTARRELKLHVDPIDTEFLTGFGDLMAR